MKIIYGIEANDIIIEVPEFIELISSSTSIFDFHDGIFMFETKEDASLAASLLIEGGLLESEIELIFTEKGEKGETFSDFGLTSELGIYLIRELVCSFSIVKGDVDAIQMASYQFLEHFVFKTADNPPIYFVERHLQELVTGIANAYDIEVSFFELDK